jgi:hypothetical protein
VLAKVSPISVLLVIAVLAVAVNVARDKIPMSWWEDTSDEPADCPGGDPYFCDEGVLAGPNAARIILQASKTCINTGYLCTELEESGSQRTYRWPDTTTRLRIRIPSPPQVDQNVARDLQRAAVREFNTGAGSPLS